MVKWKRIVHLEKEKHKISSTSDIGYRISDIGQGRGRGRDCRGRGRDRGEADGASGGAYRMLHATCCMLQYRMMADGDG